MMGEEKTRQEMVEVYRGLYSDVIVVKSLLESAGIPCVIKSHATIGVHTFTVNGLAEAWILIRREDVERALELLSQCGETEVQGESGAPLSSPEQD